MEEESPGPLPSRNEVLATQFSSWYPIFSNLSTAPKTTTTTTTNAFQQHRRPRTNVTIKSVVIELPESFREYLQADGVRLPEGALVSSCLRQDGSSSPRDDDKSSSDDDGWSSSSSGDNDDPKTFSFPDLDQAIHQAVEYLGGYVVPKLNWSCPKDAVWLNAGTLKCETPGDVYLLLKASDFCSYDLHHALHDVVSAATNDADDYTRCGDDVCPAAPFTLQLALRKWCNLYPSQEFRCFVRDQQLIAICQRQSSQHYPHIVRELDLYKSLVVEFYDDIVHERCCDHLTNYVFDVYIDKKSRTWLVDLNVWGRRTDALLFSWSELITMQKDEEGPEMRVVETEGLVRTDPLSSYRAPIDTLHVASLVGGDAKKFEEFMKLCEPCDTLNAEEVERQRRELDETE
jgi:hypothetical protein